MTQQNPAGTSTQVRQIAKNSSLNLLTTLVAFVTGTGASIIAARLLGPADLGLFAFVNWTFTTLLLLVDPGLSSAIAKFVSELLGSGKQAIGNTLTLAVLLVQAGIGMLAGLLLWALGDQIANLMGQPPAGLYLPVMGLAVPTAMIAGILRARLSGFQRYDLISLAGIVNSCFLLVGTVVVLAQGLGVRGLVLLTVAGSFLQLALFAFFVPRQRNLWRLEPVPAQMIRRVLSYSVGVFFITSLDSIIWQRSETFFLGLFSTTEQIAYYGLAYSIAGILVTMLPAAISGVLMPALSNYHGAGQRDRMQDIYARTTKYVEIVVLPVCLGGIAIARPMVELFYGPAYLPVVELLRILLVASAVGAMAGPGSGLFLALGKPYLAVFWAIPIAVLNVGLAFVLVKAHGAMGAAVANSVCQVLGVMFGTAYLIRFQRFSLPFAALGRAVAAATISSLVAYATVESLADWPGLVAGISLGAILYFPALVMCRAVDERDFSVLRQTVVGLPPFASSWCNHFIRIVESIVYRWRPLHARSKT